MRLLKKFRVTFFSLVLLLVNLVSALTPLDSHKSPDIAAPPESGGIQTNQDVMNKDSQNQSQPYPTATEVHFENLQTRYTGHPPTSQSHESSDEHYDRSHYQNDGHHFAGASASSLIGRDNCKLPDSWKGQWFQSGQLEKITIDGKHMGEKGNCIETSGDKFLFVEKNTNCHRCVVINERHHNVLQYKESLYCEERESLEHLCSNIPGDATLYSIFRIDAQAEECPFKGAPYTFTYNRGHGECKNPVSFIDTCTEPSRLRLRYQACPDILKTESTVEELQCLAQWKEGSHHYLLGKLRPDHRTTTNEDAYRCFIFEKTKTGHMGYNVAISGDATCAGVTSPTEGPKTLILNKVEKEPMKCRFPSWLSSSHWYTLDGKMSAKMHKNSTMHITDDNRRNSSGHYSSLSSLMTNSGSFPGGYIGGGIMSTIGGGSNGPLLFSGGTRIVCQNRKDISDRHVAIVAHSTFGCKRETICMHIYKRHSHVMEIQMVKRSDHEMEDSDCLKPDALGTSLPYVTLVNPEAKVHRCPNLGKYMASGVTQDGRVVRDSCGPSVGPGAFQSVVVGCGSRQTMDFHSKCPTQDPTSYVCHGDWEEHGTGFLIASPLSRSSTSAHRFCFTYSESDEGLRVFSSSESCRRNVMPGIEGVWAFNLTVDGQCAEAVTGASASFPKSCDLLISVAVLLSVILSSFSNLLTKSTTLTLVSSSMLSQSFTSSSLLLSSSKDSPEESERQRRNYYRISR